MILIVSFLVVVVVFFGWFYRHQVLLRDRAHLMREAIRNEEFTFRLPVKGLFFGERALQEALNETGKDIGVLLARNEVESWQRLTRVLTHEIMNSITPIISLSETLSERGVPVALKDAGGEKEYAVMLQAMQTIHRRSKGLLGFVENYRRLTRLPAPVCASVSVRELFTDLQKLFPDETIHFELPPSEKILNVDRAQIEQVLINLLKNAREASGRREEPRIEVKAAFAPKVTSSLTSWRCTITVRDNGEGILPEVQDKIFVPFFTTKTAGSGIGLSLCKQIMNQHGGNISVYSEAGKGSCFTLQFS